MIGTTGRRRATRCRCVSETPGGRAGAASSGASTTATTSRRPPGPRASRRSRGERARGAAAGRCPKTLPSEIPRRVPPHTPGLRSERTKKSTREKKSARKREVGLVQRSASPGRDGYAFHFPRPDRGSGARLGSAYRVPRPSWTTTSKSSVARPAVTGIQRNPRTT